MARNRPILLVCLAVFGLMTGQQMVMAGPTLLATRDERQTDELPQLEGVR